MFQRGVFFSIPNDKQRLSEAAASVGAAFFLYLNSFESIGHCCEVVFGDRFWVDNALLLAYLLAFSIPFAIGYLERRYKRGILLLVLLCLAIFFSVINNVILWDYIKASLWTIFLCWFLFVVFQYADLNLLFEKIKKQRWFFLVFFIISYFLLDQEVYIESSKQVISYNVAAIAILFFLCFLSEKDRIRKSFELLAFFISFILTLAMSSRGAIIAILFAIGLFIATSYKGVLLLILSSVILLLYLDDVLRFLEHVLYLFHINSRITLYLNVESFFAQEGRRLIYHNIINAIHENGLVGTGLFSDRLYLYNHIGIKTYAHNIALEMLCNFGWVVGSLILGIALFLILFPIIYKNTPIRFKYLVCLFTVRGLSCLIFSGSYITTYEFYVLISIGVLTIRQKSIYKHKNE